MAIVNESNKIEFFKFLNGDISISDFENFIYNTTELEQQLDENIYFELISNDFKDKNVITRLSNLIKKEIIEEGQFETWKLRQVLKALINDSQNLPLYLDKLYHAYCGIYQDKEKRKYRLKFLANLGLNYLYWIDEAYMKVNYKDRWKQEYDKSLQNLEFYHQQLKPFAEEVLSALDNMDIVILNDGNYQIKDELKSKLETDKIYTLEHPKS